MSKKSAWSPLALVPDSGTQRIHALSIFVNSLGFGLVIPIVTLYFTQVVNLSALEVGIGFSIAGVVALLGGPIAGNLADRYGPREVVVVTMLMQAVAAAAYLFIGSLTAFVIVSAVEMAVTAASMAAGGALTRRVGGDDAVTHRSRVRSVSNLGILLGVAGSAIAVRIGTDTAYQAMLAANAATFLLAALLILRVPHFAPLTRTGGDGEPAGSRWVAMRDGSFVAYSAVAGLMSVKSAVIDMPLPLWVVAFTLAPPWLVSALILINALMVIVLQVRVGEKVQTLAQGGRAMRAAGALYLVGAAGIALAADAPGWLAAILLVAAVVVHTLGELASSTGSFAMEYGLAPAELQGQYGGIAGIGSGLGQAIAPLVLLGWVISVGIIGWLALGGAALVLGLLAPGIAAWGERTRPNTTSQPEPPEPLDPPAGTTPVSPAGTLAV